MQYHEHRPDPRLRAAIRCYWFLQGTLEHPEPERILPDGCCELVFHCGDRFRQHSDSGSVDQPHTLLIGPSTRALVIRPGHQVDVIGIRFHPSGAALLGGAPPSELRDRVIHAFDVDLRLPPDLLDRLADAPSHRDRVAMLDRLMLHRLERAVLDEPMLMLQRCMALSGGSIPTRVLAQLTGLSVRQLQRRFLAASGVTPKLLSRLMRMQRALVAAQQPGTSLAAVAATAGYADQSHFTRDFREFAGVTPSQHFRGSRELSNFFVADAAE